MLEIASFVSRVDHVQKSTEIRRDPGPAATVWYIQRSSGGLDVRYDFSGFLTFLDPT